METAGNINPSAWYGETWALVAVEGKKTTIVNTHTYAEILYQGVSARVNINCGNYTLGNQNVTYTFQSYGLNVAQTNFSLMLVPINYTFWYDVHYANSSATINITKLTDYSFSEDSNHGANWKIE
jgi:hypothetical protein